jgi:hypothetical protein
VAGPNFCKGEVSAKDGGFDPGSGRKLTNILG